MICRGLLLFNLLFPTGKARFEEVDYFIEAAARDLAAGEYLVIKNVPEDRRIPLKMVFNTFPQIIATILPDGTIRITKVQGR